MNAGDIEREVAAVRLVAIREIRQGVRSRAFRISTVLALVLVAVVGALPGILQGPKGTTYDVAARDAAWVAAYVPAVADTADVTVRVRNIDASRLSQAVEDGTIDVAVIGAGPAAAGGPAGAILSNDAVASELLTVLNQAHALAVQNERVAASGLTTAQQRELFAPVAPLDVRQLDARANDPGRLAVASITVVALFLVLSLYGAAVLNGVLQEKSSRVVEVVLSAVSPTELLAGKLIGIGLLGLGQVAALAAVGLVATNVGGSVDLPTSTASTLVLSVVWFVLGYALFSSLFAMAGSLVSRQEDAQAAATPVSLLMTGSYVLTFALVLPSPDGVAARIVTFLPFTAPMAVLARSAFGAISWWEIVGAAVVTIATTVVIVRLAAVVYTRAALRFGARVKLREVLGRR